VPKATVVIQIGLNMQLEAFGARKTIHGPFLCGNIISGIMQLCSEKWQIFSNDSARPRSRSCDAVDTSLDDLVSIRVPVPFRGARIRLLPPTKTVSVHRVTIANTWCERVTYLSQRTSRSLSVKISSFPDSW
jgi:hypothetical protein